MEDRLNWDEGYSVGVRSLDEDHRQLFESVNGLIDEIGHGSRGAAIQEALDLILEDIVEHFDREEALLEKVGFPELQEHQADHYLLLRTVLRFKTELKYDRLDTAAAARFLVAWVREHLVKQDLKFKPYVPGQGGG